MFEYVVDIAQQVDKRLASCAELTNDPGLLEFDWFNRVYTSKNFARGHVEVLDRIDSNGMWIMHTVITPHPTCPDPIFGFDIVVTSKKISGVFHDYTPVVEGWGDRLMGHFEARSKAFGLVCIDRSNKVRELPEWGKQLFSPYMLALGAINTEEDAKVVCEYCLKNLDYYLDNVNKSDVPRLKRQIIEGQNRYARLQKQNPYPVKMLMRFGLTQEAAERFVNKHLFPETK